MGILKHNYNIAFQNTHPPPFTDFKSKNGCIPNENAYKSVQFFLSLEEHSVYYSNENSFCAPAFSWQLGFMFCHTSAQMGIPRIKCVLEELWKTNSQNLQPTQVLK